MYGAPAVGTVPRYRVYVRVAQIADGIDKFRLRRQRHFHSENPAEALAECHRLLVGDRFHGVILRRLVAARILLHYERVELLRDLRFEHFLPAGADRKEGRLHELLDIRDLPYGKIEVAHADEILGSYVRISREILSELLDAGDEVRREVGGFGYVGRPHRLRKLPVDGGNLGGVYAAFGLRRKV